MSFFNNIKQAFRIAAEPIIHLAEPEVMNITNAVCHDDVNLLKYLTRKASRQEINSALVISEYNQSLNAARYLIEERHATFDGELIKRLKEQELYLKNYTEEGEENSLTKSQRMRHYEAYKEFAAYFHYLADSKADSFQPDNPSQTTKHGKLDL